jgi:hypothetical protein
MMMMMMMMMMMVMMAELRAILVEFAYDATPLRTFR